MSKYQTVDNRCLVCGLPDADKPMVFRMTDWCSDDHRKVITGELTARNGWREEVVSMQVGIGMRLFNTGPVSREKAGEIVDAGSRVGSNFFGKWL